MSLGSALVSWDRLRHTTPLTVGSASRRIAGSALANARQSLHDITATVEDRRELQRELPEPGQLQRLTPDECFALLASTTTGRLAYIRRRGIPDIVPVNFALDGNSIVMRSGPGPKLQAAERGEHVAFEVDSFDEASHSGWSVVVSGLAHLVPPHAAGSEPSPWALGPRRHTMRINIGRIDGRRLL